MVTREGSFIPRVEPVRSASESARSEESLTFPFFNFFVCFLFFSSFLNILVKLCQDQ